MEDGRSSKLISPELSNNVGKSVVPMSSTTWKSAENFCPSLSEHIQPPEEELNRACDVYLVFTRVTTSGVGFWPSSCCEDTSKHSAMHWKAVFKFAENKTRVYHAVPVDNELTGRCEQRSKPPSVDENTKTVFLGKFAISQEAVDRAFSSMNTGLNYHLLWNNCQTWLVQLLERLGIMLPEEVKTIAQQIQSHFSSGCERKTLKCIAETFDMTLRIGMYSHILMLNMLKRVIITDEKRRTQFQSHIDALVARCGLHLAMCPAPERWCGKSCHLCGS